MNDYDLRLAGHVKNITANVLQMSYTAQKMKFKFLNSAKARKTDREVDIEWIIRHGLGPQTNTALRLNHFNSLQQVFKRKKNYKKRALMSHPFYVPLENIKNDSSDKSELRVNENLGFESRPKLFDVDFRFFFLCV